MADPPSSAGDVRGDHDDADDHPVDVGFTHVAIPASDMDASIAFYAEFADMEVVHLRGEPGERVAWITDRTRPFVIVLMERSVDHRLGGWSHLGIGLVSREAVDRALRRASEAGHDVQGAFDDGPPVGYWGIIADPDGHQLEVAYGQEVGFTVAHAG
jgi:catechol 2,3-dioxygenase-like lactoylglutathione lyase family enzyme